MLFEDALKELRNGKAITHPTLEDVVYYIACRVSLQFEKDKLEYKNSDLLSIAMMKGDRQHTDMGTGGSFEHIPRDLEKPCKHGYAPQLNLFLVMADDWEIYKPENDDV